MKKIALFLLLLVAGNSHAASWKSTESEDTSIDGGEIVFTENSAGSGNNWLSLSAIKTWINSIPGPIGGTTPNAGTFTNLTATGTVSLPPVSALGFEGSTTDDNETSFVVTDPTVDRNIYVGDYDTRLPKSDQVNTDGTIIGGGCTLVATAPYRDSAGTAGECQVTADGAYIYSTDHWEVWHLFTDTLSNAPPPETCTTSTDSEVWTTSQTATSGEGSVGWVASKVVLAVGKDITSMVVSTYDPTPSGNLTVSIQTDNAGSPSGTVVGTITKTEASANSSVADQEFELSAAEELSAGTYWLVAARADTGILFGKSGGTCSTSDSKYSTNGTSWTGTPTCFDMALNGCSL